MSRVERILLTTLTVTGDLALEEVGLVSLASTLRAGGYQVEILDCKGGEIADEQAVRRFAPQLFGIGIYSATKEPALRLCERMKELFPEIVICAGGYFPTYYSRELIAEAHCIDFVVRGEGELVLLDAIERLDSLEDVPGITFRKEGTPISNEGGEIVQDLDSLPFPIDEAIYSRKDLELVYVNSSRGCMTNCSFCLAASFNKRWRGFSPERVVDGVAEIYRTYGKRIFGFTDNSFEDSLARHVPPDGAAGTINANRDLVTGSRKLTLLGESAPPKASGEHALSRMAQIAEGFLERGLKISYYVNVKATFCKIATPRLMDLLIQSGLTNVYIGLESGNDFDLELYDKRCTVEDNQRALRFFREYGIFPSTGFISFNPYSTFERLRENLEFLRTYGYGCQLSFVNRVILYRGTRLLKLAERDGIVIPGSKYDEHGYHFVDPRVGKLSDFLANAVRPYRLNAGNPTYGSMMPYLFEIYRGRLHYFRREAPPHAAELQQELDAMERALETSMLRLTESNTRCFGALLDLAERDWDEDKARGIMAERFDYDLAVSELNDLFAQKERLDGVLGQAGFPEALLC